MLQSRVISEASFTFVSIREFMVVNRACFQIQGFIFRLRLYFKWAIPISGFATTTTRANNTLSRCATTWLPTSTSGGYSAAPLPSSPETGLTSHCESDKLSLLSLVRMTLTRNNHCERGFMLVNNPSSSRLKMVNEQIAQHNLSVKHIWCPPTNIREQWIRRTYRQCTPALCIQRSNVTNGDGIASLSHLTIDSCKGNRDGSGWGPTLSSFRRRHSARRISPLPFVHGSIGTVVAGERTYASSMCTSISQLNEIIREEQFCSRDGWTSMWFDRRHFCISSDGLIFNSFLPGLSLTPS